MKKAVSVLLTLALMIALGGVSALAAGGSLAPGTPELNTTDSNGPMFFANGTAITISQRTDGQDGAHIAWEGGSMDVSSATSVFGGGHQHEGVYASTSIVMNGGTVNNLIGGGLHKSQVDSANIVINGGTATGVTGGGASSMNGTTCHKPWYAGDAKQSTCRVEHANVEINGGKITALLFGGGEGISYTGSASLTITDGDMSAAWVTAGGSNGYTGSAGVTVQGGTIHVLQSVNRGTMDEATMKVSAGTIDSMYVGGESGDTSVTGSIAAVTAAVLGGTVNELNPGTSGGTLIAPDEGKMNVTYLPDSVGNQDDLGTAFGDQIKAIYTVRFETGGGSAVDSVSVTEGETLTLPAAPSREGYTFTGWYRDETLADLWDQGDPVTAHMSLYAGWEKNTYLVTFAGSLLPTASVAYGDKIVKPNDPLKQGYTFAGWYADADFAAAWDFNTPVTANTVLYAKWRKAAPPAPEQPEHNQPGDNPQTGDAGQAGVPLLILSGALAGFAILIRQKKKAKRV